jgi:G8 domain
MTSPRRIIRLLAVLLLATAAGVQASMGHHAGDMRALNLVSDEAATHISAQNGAWEDPATWGGSVPHDGARVIIAADHEVEVGSKLAPALRTLRVDGKLSFNSALDTEMTFDTLLVNMSGTLEIGSESLPVEDGKTAQLIVADYNQQGFEISDLHSPDYDPAKLGLGVISMGTVQMFGQEKTPFVSIGELYQFTTVITLDETPEGWKAGDKIVITNGYDTYGSTGYDKYKNAEVRRIANIEGQALTLNKPLAYEHIVSKPAASALSFDLHVLNIERNIKIETTESGRAGTPTTSTSSKDHGKETFESRGHIMFMSSNDVSINYVEMGHLGRSSKQLPADDTVFNADGSVQSIGSNPRARYPLHFHRTGSESEPATIRGAAVFFGPGWGFVNHGGNVNMSDNVAYGVAGASFVTERGDEQGSFVGNFSAGTYGGSNTKWHKRGKIEDFGHTGNGFWFQGLNIRVNDNIANGCDAACFNFVGMGIDGIADSAVNRLKLIEFNNNTAYNSGSGLMVWGLKRGSEFNRLKAYAVKTGVNATLAKNLVFNDSVVIAAASEHPGSAGGSGFNSGYKTRGYTFRNSYVSGFGTGIVMPWGIGATVENGYFDNDTDIFIRNTMFSRRHTHNILGDITFANDENNIVFSYNKGKLEKARHLYTVRNITLDIASMGKKYAAYDSTQAADYVPFKKSGPAEFIGLTNTEILEKTSSYETFKYWAKKLRVNNSSLKQLVPGGKLMPENVISLGNMSDQYLQELGEASVPSSAMPMPDGRTSGSSTDDISPTGLVTETTTTDIEGCVMIGGVCAEIETAYTPHIPDNF